MRSRFSVLRTVGSGNANNNATMTTVSVRRSQRASAFKEWLGAKSEFFSLLMEVSVSRLTVIRVHLILVSLMLGAFTATVSFAGAALFGIFAAMQTSHLNINGKGGMK